MQKKYHTHKKTIVNTKQCLSLQFYYFKNLFKLVLRFLSKFKPFHFKLESEKLDTTIISKVWMTLFKLRSTRKGPQPVRDISTPWKCKHLLSYLWFCSEKHKGKSFFQNFSRNFKCFKRYTLHSFRFYIRWCVMCTWVL